MSKPNLGHLQMLVPDHVKVEQGPGGAYGIQLTIFAPIHMMPAKLAVVRAAVEEWLVQEHRRSVMEDE